MRRIQMSTSRGYRDQLDRVHRFLDRIESTEPRRDVDYQDDVWAFFQNCWHLKDWLRHDAVVGEQLGKELARQAEDSPILIFAGGMANGTKHLINFGPGISAAHQKWCRPSGDHFATICHQSSPSCRNSVSFTPLYCDELIPELGQFRIETNSGGHMQSMVSASASLRNSLAFGDVPLQ